MKFFINTIHFINGRVLLKKKKHRPNNNINNVIIRTDHGILPLLPYYIVK